MYTKAKIREIRKGIQLGELITLEQEEMLSFLGIPINKYEGEERIYFIQNQIDGRLRAMSPKRRTYA